MSEASNFADRLQEAKGSCLPLLQEPSAKHCGHEFLALDGTVLAIEHVGSTRGEPHNCGFIPASELHRAGENVFVMRGGSEGRPEHLVLVASSEVHYRTVRAADWYRRGDPNWHEPDKNKRKCDASAAVL
jgi:hypothetical protein